MNDRSLSPLRKTPYPERNLIIGGGFDFWQLGTSFSNATTYTADKFKVSKSHSGVIGVTQDTDRPTSAVGTYSLKYTVTTGATTTSSNFGALQHPIESYLIAPLASKAVTVSFWYKSNVTGTHTFSLIESGSQLYRYTHPFTINQADTWTFIEHTITLSANADYGNGIDNTGMTLSFNASVGSDYHGDSDSWVTNGDFGVSGQVDLLATTNNYFQLADVMMSQGSEAIPFSRSGVDLSNELLLCQRYYYTIGGSFRGYTAYVQTSTFAYATIHCPVDMRATPTFGSPTHNIASATLGDIRDVGNASYVYNTTNYTIGAIKLSSNSLGLSFTKAAGPNFVTLGPAVMRVASGVLLSFDANL